MRFVLALALVASGWLVAGRPVATQNASQVQRLELAAPGGTLTATLRLPATPGRVPVTLIVAGPAPTDEQALADALAAQGIASLRPEPRPADGNAGVGVASALATIERTARDSAAWITRLRNDARFSRVMVIGQDDGSVAAMRAGRAARADGVVSLGASATASVPPAESIRPTIPILAASGADELQNIVRFIRNTPVPRHPESERRSPRDVVMTEIAGCRVAIEYGRPSKRGRAIWGSLVPWDAWWMPGADEATTLTTSEPIVLDRLSVPAGDYTLYTLPGELAFSLIISTETGQFHTVYHPERDLGRVLMTPARIASPVEQLTFVVEARGTGGVLKLIWDDREHAVPFVVRKAE